MKSFFMLLVLMVGCNSYSENYAYEEGLDKYFEEVQLEIEKTKSKILLISTSSCNSCVTKTLNLLDQNEINPLAILLVGDTVNYSNLALTKDLQDKYSIHFDLKQNIRQYQTGFGNLLFLKYSSGKISDYLEINESNIDQFERRFFK